MSGWWAAMVVYLLINNTLQGWTLHQLGKAFHRHVMEHRDVASGISAWESFR